MHLTVEEVDRLVTRLNDEINDYIDDAMEYFSSQSGSLKEDLDKIIEVHQNRRLIESLNLKLPSSKQRKSYEPPKKKRKKPNFNQLIKDAEKISIDEIVQWTESSDFRENKFKETDTP